MRRLKTITLVLLVLCPVLAFAWTRGLVKDSVTNICQQTVLFSAAAMSDLKTLWVAAGLWDTRTTNGALAGTSETTTNKVMARYFEFNPDTLMYAQTPVTLPARWDCGPVKAKIVWTAASAVESAVVWELRAGAFRDNSTYDTALGETVQITDTHGGTGKVNITAASSALTVAGTPVGGDLVVFELYRNAATATDTLEESARAQGVLIQFGESAVAGSAW